MWVDNAAASALSEVPAMHTSSIRRRPNRSIIRESPSAKIAENEIHANRLAIPDSPRLKLFAIQGEPMPLIDIVKPLNANTIAIERTSRRLFRAAWGVSSPLEAPAMLAAEIASSG